MIYEVPLVSISTDRQTVSVHWLECVVFPSQPAALAELTLLVHPFSGRAIETPWTTVVDPNAHVIKATKKVSESGAAQGRTVVVHNSAPPSAPFDHSRGEQLFIRPNGRAFDNAPADLSDVDPSLLDGDAGHFATVSAALPALSSSLDSSVEQVRALAPAPTIPVGKNIRISPAIQKLLDQDPTLRSLFLSVGWPASTPPTPSGSRPAAKISAVPSAPPTFVVRPSAPPPAIQGAARLPRPDLASLLTAPPVSAQATLQSTLPTAASQPPA